MDAQDEEICKLRERIAALTQKATDDDKALLLAKGFMWSAIMAGIALAAALIALFRK